VTVLSTVPTLLTILAEDIPTLRLLILGGEACPPHLVDLWSRPGRRIVNTYGPTETTVIATCAELRPGRPVTIGRAISGYRVHLLDESLRPVRPARRGRSASAASAWRAATSTAPTRRARASCRTVRARRVRAGGYDAARLYRTGDLGGSTRRGKSSSSGASTGR